VGGGGGWEIVFGDWKCIATPRKEIIPAQRKEKGSLPRSASKIQLWEKPSQTRHRRAKRQKPVPRGRLLCCTGVLGGGGPPESGCRVDRTKTSRDPQNRRTLRVGGGGRLPETSENIKKAQCRTKKTRRVSHATPLVARCKKGLKSGVRGRDKKCFRGEVSNSFFRRSVTLQPKLFRPIHKKSAAIGGVKNRKKAFSRPYAKKESEVLGDFFRIRRKKK